MFHFARIGIAAAVVSLMTITGLALSVAPASASPTTIEYVLLPHPDDENTMWSRVTGRSTTTGHNQAATYKVIIYMTRGEETAACRTVSDPDGPGSAWYEGPSSPSGEPNYGETYPWGSGSSWTGKWTSGCKAARMRSTIGYLNDKAASDPTLPSGLAYSATHSFVGNTSAGIPPQRFDAGGAVVNSYSVDVYTSSNGMGMVLFYDLGDGGTDLTKEEVSWALGATRWNRATIGIPALPEREVNGPYFNSLYTACQSYPNLNHRAVHEAIWNYDLLGSKPQYAATCSTDPDKSRTDSVSATEHSQNVSGSTTTRTGLLQKRYGWLIDGWWDGTWTCSACALTSTQSFWRRF